MTKTEENIVIAGVSFDGLRNWPKKMDALNKIFLNLSYDKEDLNPLWHLYVITLCTFLESFLRDSYKLNLRKNINHISDFDHLHLIEEATGSLNRLSWEGLINSTLYLEGPIPENIKIRILF